MKKCLFEKLYCLSFSHKGEPAQLIAPLLDIVKKALNLCQVVVFERNLEGYKVVASSPLYIGGFDEICGTKNCVRVELRNQKGWNIGVLFLVFKKRYKMTPKLKKIVNAFTCHISGLMADREDIASCELHLKKEIDRYRYLLTHDNLTGLYNRYYFEEHIKLLEGSDKYPISIIMIDVDGLKIINDTMGHRYGDEALTAAAELLKYAFRKEDIVTRIGGDEFAVLLPETPQTVAIQRCRILSEALKKRNKTNKVPFLSLSTGFATSNGPDQPLMDVLEAADINMYGQKTKNRLKTSKAILFNCRPFIAKPAENIVSI
ncbi:MAG: putative diguanylate cyclase AdrA [Pelotomaculum sp. PtaU1.Bin035]|nr:MAG: putative diguanylate cyclase AdrA [Pelotomaculum sp. PtaU1.Bin035]